MPTFTQSPHKETIWDRRARPTSSFWKLHAASLLFCLVGELLSILALLTLGPLFLKMGLAAIFYLGLITFSIVAFTALPVRWVLQHRSFRRALDM